MDNLVSLEEQLHNLASKAGNEESENKVMIACLRQIKHIISDESISEKTHAISHLINTTFNILRR